MGFVRVQKTNFMESKMFISGSNIAFLRAKYSNFDGHFLGSKIEFLQVTDGIFEGSNCSFEGQKETRVRQE